MVAVGCCFCCGCCCCCCCCCLSHITQGTKAEEVITSKAPVIRPTASGPGLVGGLGSGTGARSGQGNAPGQGLEAALSAVWTPPPVVPQPQQQPQSQPQQPASTQGPSISTSYPPSSSGGGAVRTPLHENNENNEGFRCEYGNKMSLSECERICLTVRAETVVGKSMVHLALQLCPVLPLYLLLILHLLLTHILTLILLTILIL